MHRYREQIVLMWPALQLGCCRKPRLRVSHGSADCTFQDSSTRPLGCRTLVEGAAADVVVYDLDQLNILPMEVVHDFPGGEWRRVQRAEGYKTVMVNGESIFEDGHETGAVPGRLLRHGG